MNRGLNNAPSDKSIDASRRPGDPYLLSPDARVDADVSIVVVNRDGGAVLDRCVESLLAQRGVTSEILVVDNASSSDEAASLRERFPTIRVVPLTANLGFAGGANEGIARTSGPLV